MAGKSLAQITLAIVADTARYSSGIDKARKDTNQSVKLMGSSLSEFKTKSAKEFGLAGKEAELFAQKQKIVVAALVKTATTSGNEMKRVSASLKLAKMDSEAFAKVTETSQDKIAKAFTGTSRSVEATKQQFKSLSQSTAELAKKTEDSTGKMAKSFAGLKTPLAGLATSLVALVGVSSIKGTLDLASTFNTLNQRVKTATKETGDYSTVLEKLYQLSIKNGSAMADTVSVFQGLARSSKELGANNDQMLKLTDTMQKLGVIGGSSASAMSAGLLQFSQAMAGGVIHAEEWNSIVENIPEVAVRIAHGLGLSIGQTRQLMLDGKLLSKDVFDVLLKQAGQIDGEFAKLPRSMQQAYAGLETAYGKALAKIDSITGATKFAVAGIDSMTSALERMAKEAGKQYTVRGIKTDAAHETAATAKGFGRHIRDKFAGPAELINSFNPFIPEKQRLTLGQVAYNQQMRDRNKQELYENELRLPPDAPAATKGANAGAQPPPIKEDKKHKADVNRANDLIASMRAQNAELEAKLRHDDEAITKEKALLKLSKDRTLTDKERTTYTKQINELAAQHAQLIKQETIQKESEKLSEILAGHKEKIALLKNELSGNTENNALLTAQQQIQDAVKVGKVETLKAQQDILAAAKEEAVLRDAVKLKGIEESLKQQLDSTKAKNDHAKELIPILDAEKRIRDAITAGMGENVAAQQRIRDLAKQIADEQLSKSFSDEQAKLDKIGESMADENEKLALKLKGQEHLAKYLDGERDLRKQIAEYAKEEAEHIKAIQDSEGLTDAAKNERIQKVKDGYSKLTDTASSKIGEVRQQAQENTKLNQALSDQEKILENIKDGTGSYKQKLVELDAQYLKGNITQKQWQKTSEELWKTQTKTNNSLGDGIKQIGNNFTQAILNGQKLNDVIKNMGKALAALAAQKLIFEPLAKGIDGLAAKLFGTGKYTPKPQMPGTNSSSSSLAGGSAAQNALDIAQQFGLPQYASGGYYDGGPMLVGERGPEIMWPQSGGYVQNNRDAMSMFGGYGAMPGGSSGFSSNQDIALNSIGAWRQRAQDALSSGRPLSYFELQEGNAQAYDTYKRGLDWSSSDELDLARVMDGIKRAEGNAYLENDRNNSDISFNWRAIKANEMSTDGGGFARSVEAGGRANFADGNQQRELLKRADDLNIPVPGSLRNKAGLMADVWDQQDRISGGTMQSRNFLNVMGSYMGSGGHSMGMGAGQGTTNNGAVYGGDPWDINSGANGSERMDAMGGKDYMWNKFHPNGNGYEGVKDMWGYTHSAAHNQGRDFVGWDGRGDKGHRGGYVNEYQPQDSWVNANGDRLTIGKDGWVTGPDGHYTKGGSRYYGDDQLEYLNPDLAAKMQRQRREAYDMTHPPISQSNGPKPPRSGYQDMIDSGSYSPVSNSDMMNGLDNLRNRSTRNGDDFSDILNAKSDAKAAKDELRRIKEEAKLEARNIKKYGPDWRQQAGDLSRLNGPFGNTALDSKGYGSLSPEGGSANNPAIMSDEQWMKEYGSTMDLGFSKGYKRIQQEQLKKITSSVYGIPNGGAVGAPGHLSASSGDVFDNYGTAYSGSGRMNDSQRMNSPYRNFADGFDDGHFGAQAGGDTGAWRPRTGWQIQGYGKSGKTIKGYASGGNITGGELALVGERGPELIRPKNDVTVTPNSRLMAAKNDGPPVIKFINNTGVAIAEPQYVPQSDGSIGMLLSAMAANGANNGVTARGVKQAGRSTPR